MERLLRDFPLSRGLFEYEDYVEAPTQGNASEFITRALEDNADQISKRENYVDYIASRPRASGEGAMRCSLTQMNLWSCLRSLMQWHIIRQHLAPHHLAAPGGCRTAGLR